MTIFMNDELVRLRQQDLARAAKHERLIARAKRHRRDLRRAASGRRRDGMRLRLERTATRVLRGRGRRRNNATARLEEAPLFRGLGKRDLALLARRVDHVRFEAGKVLASEERPHQQFVVITRGAAEASVRGRRVDVLGPGAHFGELTLVEGTPDVPTITALTDVEGFVLSRRDFWGILYAIPALSMRLTARMAEDLLRARRHHDVDHAEAS